MRLSKGEMHLPEQLLVARTIYKLPPSWKDYETYLKYKRKELGMEEQIIRLRIQEEENQISRICLESQSDGRY